jgi:hypothetical protein
MPNRRQFLTAAAATALVPLLTEDAAAVTCPVVVPGTVTGQSGSVNGATPTFVDGWGDRQGADFNWQYPVVLSDKGANPPAYGSAGVRQQQNQAVKGELYLLLALVVGKVGSTDPIPPESYPVGTAMAVNTNVEHPAGSGIFWRWTPTFVKRSTKNCNQSETTASGGTVTLASITDLEAAGSYDLSFGAGGLAALSFVAPRAGVNGSLGVSGCPTRPTSQTCLSP